MSEVEMVCAKCGSDRIYVDFTSRGSGKVEVGVDKDGKPYVDHVYDRDYDSLDEDHESFDCGDCKASWYPLAKGVKPKHVAGIDLNPGDRVWLPDGLKAVVATVDREANTFTVENWHETFKAGEGTRISSILRVSTGSIRTGAACSTRGAIGGDGLEVRADAARLPG